MNVLVVAIDLDRLAEKGQPLADLLPDVLEELGAVVLADRVAVGAGVVEIPRLGMTREERRVGTWRIAT